jgi:hypothetical protein
MDWMDRQEKAMEERQTRCVQDLSFRKQTRKQKHELTKMQPQPQGPIAASTVHRQCINPAGHRQTSEGLGHGHRHGHRRCVAGPRAVECFESESCFGRPTIRPLHDRICTSITIAIADAANSGAQSRNARRRVQGQEPVAVSIVRARRGAVYVNMASPPLQPTSARFSPRQPTPASSNPLRARSRLATPTAIPTARLQLAPLPAVVTLSLSLTVHTSLPHTAPH